MITVSALADRTASPGGVGGNACYSWGSYDTDDTYANFSNYGADVDLIAPGKCIWSTLPGNRYGYSSGTSMAAPHATGAAALWLSTRPGRPRPRRKAALQAAATLDWKTSTDPDGTPDRLLDVSRISSRSATSRWTRAGHGLDQHRRSHGVVPVEASSAPRTLRARCRSRAGQSAGHG